MTDIAPAGAARYAGTRVARVEDARLLTGHGTYVDDIALPGMLHASLRAQSVRPRAPSAASTRRRRAPLPGRARGVHRRRPQPGRQGAVAHVDRPGEPGDAPPAAGRRRGALRRRPGRAGRRREPLRSPRTRPSWSTSTTSRCRPSSTTPTAEDADSARPREPRLERHRRDRRPARRPRSTTCSPPPRTS